MATSSDEAAYPVLPIIDTSKRIDKTGGAFEHVEIFGHRGVGCSVAGGDSEYPENSIAAFERARELGVDGVELDVWLTRDNQVVVIHGGGSDLDGFLYETVVDVDAQPLLSLQRQNSRRSVSSGSNERKLSIPTNIPINKSMTTPPQSPSLTPPGPSYMSLLQRSASSASSVDSAFSTVSSIGEKVLASVQCRGTIRRIEDISYGELRKAGHLRHREPFTSFYRRTSESGGSSAHQSDISNSPASQSGGGATNIRYTTFSRAEPPYAPSTSPSTYKTSRIMRRTQLENNRLDYIESLMPYYKAGNTEEGSKNEALSEVPLLSEVFARFHNKLTFNVELKGTQRALGKRVLEVAQPFPNIIARISSFCWRCNYLDNDDETDPLTRTESGTFLAFVEEMASDKDTDQTDEGAVKKEPEDLLIDLVDNPAGVPLALLFWGKLPSVRVMLACLDDYKAEWAHFSEYCHFDTDSPAAKRDLDLARQLEPALLAVPRVEELLAISAKEGFSLRESNYQVDEIEEAAGKAPDVLENLKKQLVEDLCVLMYLTKQLHLHQRKVLVYGRHAHETSELMELCLLCGIDGICPNNVSDALAIRSS